MKEVIVLRHGEKNDKGLSAEGAEACRELARHIGQFTIVICSETERGLETASLLAGKPATEDPRANIPEFPPGASQLLRQAQLKDPLGIVGGIWTDPELIECARAAGRKLLELAEDTFRELGDNDRALIISHDGTMAAFERLLTEGPFDTVDHSFGPLQGIVVDEDLHCRPFVDPGTLAQYSS